MSVRPEDSSPWPLEESNNNIIVDNYKKGCSKSITRLVVHIRQLARTSNRAIILEHPVFSFLYDDNIKSEFLVLWALSIMMLSKNVTIYLTFTPTWLTVKQWCVANVSAVWIESFHAYIMTYKKNRFYKMYSYTNTSHGIFVRSIFLPFGKSMYVNVSCNFDFVFFWSYLFFLHFFDSM